MATKRLQNAIEIMSLCYCAGCTPDEGASMVNAFGEYPWNQIKPGDIAAHWAGEATKWRVHAPRVDRVIARLQLPQATQEGPRRGTV